MTDKEIQAIKDRYDHYPASLNKNTAVYHVRQLLAEIDRLKKS